MVPWRTLQSRNFVKSDVILHCWSISFKVCTSNIWKNQAVVHAKAKNSCNSNPFVTNYHGEGFTQFGHIRSPELSYVKFLFPSCKRIFFKHEYLRSRAYICLSLSSPPPSSSSGDISSQSMFFCQIMDYRDTHAYILDPCIQEFYDKSDLIGAKGRNIWTLRWIFIRKAKLHPQKNVKIKMYVKNSNSVQAWKLGDREKKIKGKIMKCGTRT